VEIVRASFDALEQGEIETGLSYYSDDVVFHPLVAGPYHGRAGVVEQMMDFTDDKVVLFWRHGGEGKASGIRVENEGATVFSLEGGCISLARVYASRPEALEAAGLRE
jgi:ketosteroid isomerase-like protein